MVGGAVAHPAATPNPLVAVCFAPSPSQHDKKPALEKPCAASRNSHTKPPQPCGSGRSFLCQSRGNLRKRAGWDTIEQERRAMRLLATGEFEAAEQHKLAWYNFGFLLGAATILGGSGGGAARTRKSYTRQPSE